MQDPRKFAYSSDYQMPIVGYRNEFTITVSPNEGSKITKIAHGLPYMPLLLGKVSDTQNFSSAQDITSDTTISNTTIAVCSDSTYIYVSTYSSESAAKTFYVRVVGFVPPDYEGDLSFISNDTSYRFNSDNNYPKIYAQGVLDQNTGGAVVYSLGYIPQCKAWMYYDYFSSGDFVCIDITPGITEYSNGRIRYESIVVGDKFIAYGRDIRYDDYSLDQDVKIYYHIYTEEA